MAKLIELRPRKDLLDPTFEGYKLSLDSLATYKHDLPVAVEHLSPSDEQFSYQHVKMFGLYNHLIEDPWHSEIVFFITKDLTIYRTSLHSLISQSPEFDIVWQIPKSKEESRIGCFNSSLSFASPELAVVTDGAGALYILDTSQRDAAVFQRWEVKLSSDVLANKQFHILHSLLVEPSEDQGVTELKVLLQRVEPLDRVETQVALSTLGCKEKDTPFVTCLEFLSFQHKDGHWSLNRVQRIVVPHGIEYASILNPGKSVCLITREPLGIVYDSVKSVVTPRKDLPGEPEQREPAYTWAENEEEVIVWLSFEKHTSKLDLLVEVKPQSLKVVYKNETLVEGELAHTVTADSSLWTLSDGKLEIVLPKVDKSVNWNYLVTDDSRGQKVLDAEAAAEWHQRFIHMTSEELANSGRRTEVFNNEQLEECDNMSVMDEVYLFRFDVETNKITHKAILEGNQLLFVTRRVSALAPAFCLRHDVDGLMWQPMGDEIGDSWSCINIATLQAMGYIQASKEQRKFTVCPPSNSYTAVCDAYHHVFLYRQPSSSSSGVDLVHRPTGRRVGIVARQQVLNFDSREECLGALATDTFLLLLTSSSLIAVRVNDD